MNLSFGYLVAFIIVQGCGFILYLVVSYNYLRDHYRIMQGVMKCIVLSYFWVKLLTLFLMITLMSVWSQLQDNDRASQMLEVGQTQLIFLTYALQQIIFFIFGFQMKIVEIQLCVSEEMDQEEVMKQLKRLRWIVRCIACGYTVVTISNMFFELLFYNNNNNRDEQGQKAINYLQIVGIPWQLFKVGLQVYFGYMATRFLTILNFNKSINSYRALSLIFLMTGLPALVYLSQLSASIYFVVQ